MSKPQTKLGQALQQLSKPAPDAAKATPLAGFIARGTRGDYVELPLLGRVWIELASHEFLNANEAATLEEMSRLGIPALPVTALTFEADKVVRVLACSVRDADDPTHQTPFGSFAEWADLDSDLIAACNRVYMDLRIRLDPFGVAGWTKLDESTRTVIKACIEKKNAMRLLDFGMPKLITYLLSMDGQPSNSQKPPSSSGDSSQET